MRDEGFAIVELFGFHFSREIKETILEISKKAKQIRANYDDFYSLLTHNWINMGEYQLFIPILFSILKGPNDTISWKDFHRYLLVCRESLNPFTALVKERISPSSTPHFIQN
jgi:hypothetical protein